MSLKGKHKVVCGHKDCKTYKFIDKNIPIWDCGGHEDLKYAIPINIGHSVDKQAMIGYIQSPQEIYDILLEDPDALDFKVVHIQTSAGDTLVSHIAIIPKGD